MDLLTLRRLNSGMLKSKSHLGLVQPETNGGKIGKAQIDALDEHADVRSISISGLDQSTLEYLVVKHGARLEAIEFWKCPRLSNLSPLEDIPRLQAVSLYWNQKAERLWDFSRNPLLRALRFTDFTKLNTLDDLARATALSELEFGGEIDNKFVLESLDPLQDLGQLRELSFGARKIQDGRIEPLAKLVDLRSLNFGIGLFTTPQIAWLKSRLRDTVSSEVLRATRKIDPPLAIGNKNIDTFVVGFGKPSLDSARDAGRLDKYEREFAAMVEYFKAHSDASPNDYPVKGLSKHQREQS
jgi:hypothetical protein